MPPNRFIVEVHGMHEVRIRNPPTEPFSAQSATELAAWLLTMASIVSDKSEDEIKAEFDRLYAECQA